MMDKKFQQNLEEKTTMQTYLMSQNYILKNS